MTKSETYKDQGVGAKKMRSEALYQQGKGDEVGDYSFNYKLDVAGNYVSEPVLKTTSKFYYGATFMTADNAAITSETAMTKSETYKDQGVVANKMQSETFYQQGKGDEVADYSFNYKLDVAGNYVSEPVLKTT